MNRNMKSVYCYFLSKRFRKLPKHLRIPWLLPPYIEGQIEWVNQYIKPYIRG